MNSSLSSGTILSPSRTSLLYDPTAQAMRKQTCDEKKEGKGESVMTSVGNDS